jgi:hypothetical protein
MWSLTINYARLPRLDRPTRESVRLGTAVREKT